jgi:hypothetical protein
VTNLKRFKKKLQLLMHHSADLEPTPPADLLINAAKESTSSPLLRGDICRVMSKNSKPSAHTACIEYKLSYHKEHHSISPSLVDVLMAV